MSWCFWNNKTIWLLHDRQKMKKIIILIPSNKKLMSIKEDGIEYVLSNYNFEQGVATVEVAYSAQVSLDEAKGIIDRKDLVGLTEDQILKFLESEAGTGPDKRFESFEIRFSPAFIKKAPQLVDRIKVQIAK